MGHSAVLVAMTGAEDFLEAAVQRFSGLRPRQRAWDWQRSSVLHARRSCVSFEAKCFASWAHTRSSRVPAARGGSYVAPARETRPPSIRSKSHCGAHPSAARCSHCQFHIRLRKQQLELVWMVDVPLDDTAGAADRAEVAAAGLFVDQLLKRRFHRDEQTLPNDQRKLTARLDKLIEDGRCCRAREWQASLHQFAPTSLSSSKFGSTFAARSTRRGTSFSVALVSLWSHEKGHGSLRFSRNERTSEYSLQTCVASHLSSPTKRGRSRLGRRGAPAEGWEMVQPRGRAGP